MTEDEMVGWHHGLNGPEVEQTPGDSEGQESLTCWSPWGCKESATTEQLNNNNIQGSASLMLKTLLPSRGSLPQGFWDSFHLVPISCALLALVFWGPARCPLDPWTLIQSLALCSISLNLGTTFWISPGFWWKARESRASLKAQCKRIHLPMQEKCL